MSGHSGSSKSVHGAVNISLKYQAPLNIWMMRKRKYTVECLQQIGHQSAQKFRKSLPLHVLELAAIKCDYLATLLKKHIEWWDATRLPWQRQFPMEGSHPDEWKRLALGSQWCRTGQMFPSEKKQGVPLPNKWWHSLRCATIQVIAHRRSDQTCEAHSLPVTQDLLVDHTKNKHIKQTRTTLMLDQRSC